ncbi:MAG: hypothetical protein II540_03500, partial [Paludibacteraceae bacterium]|nr:hypothetical protein [Paludibacteraceae bacterium]
MKKLFTFFLALALGVGMMNADPTIFANFTATAGSGGFSGEDHSKLVDGKFVSSDWSKWCANAGHKSVPSGESGDACWWLDFQASTAINITGYILTTGNDSGSNSGRNPKNWVIKAKLNASDAWTTIATVTDDDVMENADFKDFAFYLDQPGTYQYFRFEILANQGANVMQLCELRLTYSTEPAPTKYTVALKEGTANADKVILSATSVLAGKTITVTPVEGYEITAFAAKYNTTEEAAATLTPKTGAYSFTMPAANVTIEATIAEKAAPDPENPKAVESGTKGGMSYTFYDTGLLEISGSGALPGRAFTNWDDGFGASVKNIRFAEDCEVYGLDYLWFACYTEKSQLETIEINSVAPIMFTGASGAGISYKQDGAVTLTITAPAIVDIENSIISNYGSPVNMIFNMPATTVFERKWFSGLRNNFAVTIPTGAKGHIPAGYVFKDPYDQKDYDNFVEMGHEADFWKYNGDRLVEGVDYTFGVESTFEITAENASQIFGQATVSFQAPTQASNSEWVQWRKSDLKEFADMSSGDEKVCKDVTVKVNNGVYNTDSGWGLHFESFAEDGVQFVAPEGKVFKRIV